MHGCIEALSKASSRVKRKTAATSALLLVVRVPVLVHVRLPGLPHHPASLSIVGLGVVGCCIVHLGIVRLGIVRLVHRPLLLHEAQGHVLLGRIVLFHIDALVIDSFVDFVAVIIFHVVHVAPLGCLLGFLRHDLPYRAQLSRRVFLGTTTRQLAHGIHGIVGIVGTSSKLYKRNAMIVCTTIRRAQAQNN